MSGADELLQLLPHLPTSLNLNLPTVFRRENLFCPTHHTLTLNQPGRGIFMLVDLNGRVVYRMTISDHGNDVPITLPPSLCRGLY